MAEELLDIGLAVSRRVAEESIKRYLRVDSPIDNSLAVSSDQELRILIEVRTAWHSAARTTWYLDGLAELEVH